MSGLAPTVQGALIGGGAAVVGFAASAWNTSRTVRASRYAARDQRLWEKRSALYEDLVALMVDFDASKSDLDQIAGFHAMLVEHLMAVDLYASEPIRKPYRAFMPVLVEKLISDAPLQDCRDLVDGFREYMREMIRAEVQGTRRPADYWSPTPWLRRRA